MNSLRALIDASLMDPAARARAAHAAGTPVIGFVGADVPVELILAADAFPLQLAAQVSGSTARADAYLEPSFLPLERSIAQQWLSGELDFITQVIFSRTSDSAQRLYYYLCELQRRGLCAGPTPLLYDLTKIPRPSSLAYAEQSTARLASLLAARPDRLIQSVALRNRRRELLRRLQGARQQPKVPSGVLADGVSRVADCCEAEQFDQSLALFLAESPLSPSGPRLILAGSTPPDARLHAAVERAGGTIVAEWGDHALDRLGSPVGLDADPIKALARHYHALPYGSRSFADRAAGLLQQVSLCRADGVVFWLIEQEEALVWDLPLQQRGLHQLSIPSLTLTRCAWQADAGVLEAVRSFAERLGAGT